MSKYWFNCGTMRWLVAKLLSFSARIFARNPQILGATWKQSPATWRNQKQVRYQSVMGGNDFLRKGLSIRLEVLNKYNFVGPATTSVLAYVPSSLNYNSFFLEGYIDRTILPLFYDYYNSTLASQGSESCSLLQPVFRRSIRRRRHSQNTKYACIP